MDTSVAHVVIVGGPEAEDELLSIVLDDGEAVPLFNSLEEARLFLDSTGDFGRDWRPEEVSPRDLIRLLEYQGEEVQHIALSPPPERLTGGMEVRILDREVFIGLLERQLEVTQPSGRRGFLRRLFRR